jgi:hypothetical protein
MNIQHDLLYKTWNAGLRRRRRRRNDVKKKIVKQKLEREEILYNENVHTYYEHRQRI